MNSEIDSGGFLLRQAFVANITLPLTNIQTVSQDVMRWVGACGAIHAAI